MIDCNCSTNNYCNSWNALGEMSPQHVGVTNHYRCTGWVICCCNKLYDMSQLHIASCVLENFCGNLCLSKVILSLWQVAQILSDLILCNLLQWQNSVAETKILPYTHSLYTDVVLFFFSFFVLFENTQRENKCGAVNKSPRVFVFLSCPFDGLRWENRGSVNRLIHTKWPVAAICNLLCSDL